MYYRFAMKFEGLTLTLTDITDYPVGSPPDLTSWKVSSPTHGTAPTESDDNPFELPLGADTHFQVKMLLKATGDIVSSVELVTSSLFIFLYQPIDQVVHSLLPGYELDQATFDLLKRKWQGVIGPAAEVPPEYIYDETKYPQLANNLIAYLIVRDILIMNSTNMLLESSSGGGATKKIVTGPTEVDFSDPGSVIKDLLGEGMPFEIFMSQLCGLAKVYHLHFHGCSGSPTTFVVFHTSDYSYEHRYIKAPEYTPKPV
jgi:hypothetical protein